MGNGPSERDLQELHAPRLLLWLTDAPLDFNELGAQKWRVRHPRTNSDLFADDLFVEYYRRFTAALMGRFSDLSPFRETLSLSPYTFDRLIRIVDKSGHIVLAKEQRRLARLSDAGWARVLELRAGFNDAPARLKYAADQYLAWLLENEGTAAYLFLTDDRSYFHGHRLDRQDLTKAERYLTERGLISPTGSGLTTNGISCVISGGSVSDYPAGGHVTNNFVGNAPGSIIGSTNHNVTQNNHFGVPAELLVQVAQFAAQVHQIAPVLGLPEPEEAQLVQTAQHLAGEATSPTPQPGRIRRLYGTIMQGISGGTGATAALTLLAVEGDKLAQAIGQLT